LRLAWPILTRHSHALPRTPLRRDDMADQIVFTFANPLGTFPIRAGDVRRPGDTPISVWARMSWPADMQWEVEAILAANVVDGQLYYLVRWAGYEVDLNAWEPLSNMDNCEELLADFERRYPAAARGNQ
jgi:hypothetical protein